MLVLDKRHEEPVVVALNHEDALTAVTVWVRVLQDVEQVAALDVEDDVLEPDAALRPELRVLRVVPVEVLHSSEDITVVCLRGTHWHRLECAQNEVRNRSSASQRTTKPTQNWPEIADFSLEEFFLWDAVPEIDSSREFGTTFDPFLVFSFVPEPETDLPAGWPTEPVALHFLHQQVESCPDFHREFIEQACRSHPSFFVIESTDPGRSIDLKDILTGRHFHVLEQSASRMLRARDVTFTRVVTAGGASIMLGASPWVIPPSWHLSVIEFRDQLFPRRLMTLADLSKCAIEVRQLYHQVVDAIVNPKLPTLQNTDGDPIEMTTMTYDLGVTAAEAFERLRPLATLRGEAHVDDERYDAAGGFEAAVLTWLKAGNRKHKDWDNTTLGTLRLDGSRLVIEVNSAKRQKRIAKEISKRFGSTPRRCPDGPSGRHVSSGWHGRLDVCGRSAAVGRHLLFERIEPCECADLERGGVPRNARLACVLHLRQSAVQRDDQFLQYPDAIRFAHRFSPDVPGHVSLQAHNGAPQRPMSRQPASLPMRAKSDASSFAIWTTSSIRGSGRTWSGACHRLASENTVRPIAPIATSTTTERTATGAPNPARARTTSESGTTMLGPKVMIFISTTRVATPGGRRSIEGSRIRDSQHRTALDETRA